MKHIWFCTTGTALSLILMGLPCSVGCGEALGLASCFSLLPASQGNWFPMLSLVFTVLALIFFLWHELYPMVPVTLGLSAASQLLAWPIFGSMTVVGFVTVSLQLMVAVASTRTCSGRYGHKSETKSVLPIDETANS